MERSISLRRAALGHASDAMLVISIGAARVLDANPAAARLWGYSQAEMREKKYTDLLADEAIASLNDLARIETERSFSLSCVCLTLAGGARRYADLHVSASWRGEEFVFLCRFTETAMLDAATELRRQNWALAAYARSSSALIRATDLNHLMRQVCAAIVEGDIYSLAAVGLVGPRPERPLRIVAGSGSASEYFNGLEITGQTTEISGSGPAGRAIRSGAVHMMRDALVDFAFAPWADRAQSFGLRSAVAVPFKNNDQVIGLLLVYAPKPDCFGPREMELFGQLAGELAFAIKLDEERLQMRAAEEDRKQAEKAIRDERDFSAALINSLPGILYLFDETGKILRWNENFRRASGYSDEEIATMHPSDFFRGADKELIGARIDDVFSKGEAGAEAGFVSRDGRITPYYLTGVRTSVDERPCLVGMGIDITERRRAEEAGREARAELARLDRISGIGELMATIAHEINQPLAAIVTNSEAARRWLAKTPPDIVEAQRAIDRIVRDLNRGSEMIRAIRYATVKRTSERRATNLNRAIDQVVAFALPHPRRFGVAISTELAPSLPRVWGDSIQLQQVMVNLILNGIDATRSVEDRPRILKIGTALAGAEQVLVTVEDNGVGLPAGAPEQIFNSLFTTKEGGTGLGLAIARSIVQAHGGRLWAEAGPNHGAIFRFTVPIAKDESK